MKNDRSGIYGAFGARVPMGKMLAALAVVAGLFACLVITKWAIGRVGWLEKGVYAQATWDSFAVRLPWSSASREKTYLVAVEKDRPGRLYTDESLASGKHVRWTWVSMYPSGMRRILAARVYGGKLAKRTSALWLGWPIWLILAMSVGQQVDMARLRRARHSGVWIRGNRIVGRGEWNNRSGEAG
jgi:hypothetical protein